MKVVIIGAGAMGSLFGALIAGVASVVLIDPWKQHVAAIKEHGLQLAGLGGDRVARVDATTDPEVVHDADLAIVFGKARQTPWAATAAQSVLAPDGVVLTLQNGLGNAEILANAVAPDRVCVGVTSQGATLLGPGRVRHAGTGPTYLALAPATERRMRAVADLFRQVGLDVYLSEDLDSVIWGKLVINVGINPLTSIMRVRTGVLAETDSLRQLMEEAAAEAAAVATAKGIRLPYDDARAQVRAIAQSTAENYSSMLQDVLRCQPTEIHTMNGAVVREAARLGIAVPVNQTLLKLIQGIEATYSQRVDHQSRELRQ